MKLQNLAQVIDRRATEHPSRSCIRFFRDGFWRDWTFAEVREKSSVIADGLAALGIAKGDRVSIFSENRPEWALADYGAICAGAVVASIYASLTAEEAAYIIDHSDSRIVFTGEPAQTERVLSVRHRLPKLERVVQLGGEIVNDPFVMTLAELERLGAQQKSNRMAAMLSELAGDDLIALTYTSGTTGLPKGAMLTHGNILNTAEMVIGAIGDMERFDLNLSFLPLAHVLERFGGHFAPLYLGKTVAYARSIDTIAEDLLMVKPSYAIVVPRVLEKVYARIFARVQEQTALRRKIFMWAVRAGNRRSEAIERRRSIGPLLALQYAIARKLVFSKIHGGVGGRLEIFVCGGAPLSAAIARFFHSVGIMVCEGWGLTETSAPATVNSPGDFKFGSVGKPMPGVELRIAEDGELLVKGLNVFRGYFKDEKATGEVFDENGFFRTGDIGRVDDEGFYYITDRKKELIITAAGKNIAPQKIETLLKEQPLISNALVHGDRRNFLVALITIDRTALRQLLPSLAESRANDAGLRAAVGAQVQVVNETLARFEQIKDFRIVEDDFSPERGEMTVTLKLKRRVVEKTYAALLDEMYPESLQVEM